MSARVPPCYRRMWAAAGMMRWRERSRSSCLLWARNGRGRETALPCEKERVGAKRLV